MPEGEWKHAERCRGINDGQPLNAATRSIPKLKREVATTGAHYNSEIRAELDHSFQEGKYRHGFSAARIRDRVRE